MKHNLTKFYEGVERQKISDSLSIQEKLAKLPANGANRERAKLRARLTNQKTQPKR